MPLRDDCLDRLCENVSDIQEARLLVRHLETEFLKLEMAIGLACPQIGIQKSIAIIRDRSTGVSINLVNPKILESSDSFAHTGE